MEKKIYNSPEDFIGENAIYLKSFKDKIKDIRKNEDMYLCYFENGAVLNFSLVKNNENVFLEDIISKKGE